MEAGLILKGEGAPVTGWASACSPATPGCGQLHCGPPAPSRQERSLPRLPCSVGRARLWCCGGSRPCPRRLLPGLLHSLWILRPPPARGRLVFPFDELPGPGVPGRWKRGPRAQGPCRPGTTSPSAPAARETGRPRGPAGGHGAGWGSVDLRPRDCSWLGPSWGAGGSCVSWFRFLPAAGRGRGGGGPGGGPAASDHKPGWVGSECGKSGSLAVPVRSGVRMPQDDCPA